MFSKLIKKTLILQYKKTLILCPETVPEKSLKMYIVFRHFSVAEK